MGLSQTERKILAKKEGRKEFALVYKDPNTGQTKYGYPIHDANHVQMAIKMFAAHYKNIPADKRATVARKIYAAARKFGIEVKTPEILQYVRLDRMAKKSELTWFLKRRHREAPVNVGQPSKYGELMKQLTHTKLNWVILDEMLRKIAEYDHYYGLDHHPNYKDPYETFDHFVLDTRVNVKIAGQYEHYQADYTKIPLPILIELLDTIEYA